MTILKTLALLLLLVNAALWFGADYLGAQDKAALGSGRLPRIADLQVVPPGPAEPPARVKPEPPPEPVTAAPETPENQETPEPESAQAGSPEVCLRVGWFDSEEGARNAIGDHKILPDTARIEEVSEPLPSFHWVLLPPASSRAEAYERFQELQSRGIDSYLVLDGPQENAISLGLFESRRAAENVLNQRQAQGLEATLASFPRNQIRYALFFGVAAKGPENGLEATIERLQSEFETVVKSGCEGVATTQKNP